MLLVSNNPKVLNDDRSQAKKLEKMPIEGGYGDVLIAVRNKIHKGHKLLTHPLSGSVKPNETPYKSVLISKEAGELDLDSLTIIGHSLESYEKFAGIGRKEAWQQAENSVKVSVAGDRLEISESFDPETLSDFAEIDYSLIGFAIDNLI